MQSLYSVDLPTLEQVVEYSPLTVLPDTLIIDVISRMNPLKSSLVESTSGFSSCVLVVKENNLVGIFTLRDVVRLTGAGVDLFRVKISEVMTQPVVSLTLAPDQNALTALSLMCQHRIRHLPLVDEQGQLVGLITQDRIRQVIQPTHLLKLRCVTEVMTTEVIHALPTTSVLELSQIMSDRQISCLVIVAKQETALIPVGMITEKDIIKVQLQGLDIAQTQAQEVMSSPVFSVSPTESLWTVHQLMQARQVRRLVVVGEQGELQGLVTQTNFLQVLDPLEIVTVIQALQAKISEQTVQLRQSNHQLQQEVIQRRQVEKSLRQAQQELELRVAKRTAELVQTNIRLQQEIEERKQAQAELQQSEWKLRAVFDSTFEFMGLLTTEGIVINANRAALDIVAANLSDVMGKPFWETPWWVHFPEQQPILQKAIARAANGEFVRMETKHIWANGKQAFVDFSLKPIFDETGTVVMLVPEGRDITDRKQSELEIRKFVSLADNSTEFIGMCDMNFVPFYLNPAGMELVGLNDTHQYSETPVREFFFPEDQDFIINEFFPRVLCEGRAEVEIRFRHFKTGEALWMVYSVSCIKDTNDQLIGLASVSRNITDRKLSEQKIAEQASLIDIGTDAIFVRDLENRILFWSRGAENLYGWTAEESVGKVAHELFHTESLSELEAALKTTVEQGSWQGELEKTTKTRRKIIVASRWTRIHNQFGQTQSILTVNTDITEKKQLEQQFYRAQRLESLGTLASGIAHDLNNVFAPIMMIAQLLPLRCRNVDKKTQELFHTLENSAKRGSELVKQILTFARGTEGKHILLQPGHLLQELVKVIKQTFPKSIEIVTDIPTNTLWMVQGDPTQLEQVFMNLAVNARDAMPNDGILTITAENRIIDKTYSRMHLEAHTGGYVVVTISDTGTGISPEFLERIFDPFFTTKEVGKGTGLGLSTVLGIVKNYGGFVDVSSQVGKGTKFQVFLPRGEGTAIETATQTDLPRGQGELILVVDDERVVQQTTQETLEHYNYKTLLANDGIEAIALYVEHKPEISAVLLDVNMPNMDGLTAIRTLLTLNPSVKIIATSGLPANQLKTITTGAKKFLSKPYTATDLLHTLSDAIGRRN